MESHRPEKVRPDRLGRCHSPLPRALWAVVIYLVVGLLWITFSDRVAALWFPDPVALSRVQTWKGFLFVIVTGMALFLALYRQLRKDRILLNLQYAQRQALRQRERQLSVLMDNLPGMAYRCLYDEYWTMLFVSGGCERLTGYTPEELINNQVVAFADLMDDEDGEKVAEAVAEAVHTNQSFSVEYAITRKDGREICVWERGCKVEAADGGVFLEGIMLDISDRKALERELEHLATTDPLTGLLNRREFGRILEEELERSERYHRPMALLWIDFDHFKEVNDTWGHAAGDRVLCSVTRLLAEGVRSVDSVARFGGEEMVVILPELNRVAALETAERLRKRIRRDPIMLDSGHEVPVTISVGVAVYPDHGHTAAELCAAADRAMYRAKAQGRDCVAMADKAEPVS